MSDERIELMISVNPERYRDFVKAAQAAGISLSATSQGLAVNVRAIESAFGHRGAKAPDNATEEELKAFIAKWKAPLSERQYSYMKLLAEKEGIEFPEEVAWSVSAAQAFADFVSDLKKFKIQPAGESVDHGSLRSDEVFYLQTWSVKDQVRASVTVSADPSEDFAKRRSKCVQHRTELVQEGDGWKVRIHLLKDAAVGKADFAVLNNASFTYPVLKGLPAARISLGTCQ